HHVNCLVTIDGHYTLHKEWDFRVPAGALLALPEFTQIDGQILGEVNAIRSDYGLPAFEFDPRLAAAARAHSGYLSANSTTGHFEQPGHPGFVGDSPGARLEAFGYVYDSWECVNFGTLDITESVRSLFDAPYHRIPFLQPGRLMIGGGCVDRRLTLEFEMTKLSGTVVSPHAGERDVPTQWSSWERPNPLRMHPGAKVVGYPIVFSRFSPRQSRLVVQEAGLWSSDGSQVPLYLNTAANDDRLTFTAFLIPQQALRASTCYTAAVRAHTEDGEDVSGKWRFTTASAQPRR
ncbi:MAG: CAP domain-containing protein, partial [Fimbriimonas ginsengisoli]|nr:CAP domain-containing protein [Fimbriimonas ginsengisoli]